MGNNLGTTTSFRVIELSVKTPGISVYEIASILEDEGFGAVSLGVIGTYRSWLRKVVSVLVANVDSVGLTLDPRWVDRIMANAKRTRLSKRERAYWKNNHGRVTEDEEPSIDTRTWQEQAADDLLEHDDGKQDF